MGFWRLLPVLVGVLLLASLIVQLIPKLIQGGVLDHGPLLDSVTAALIGAVSVGQPVVSYLMAGELQRSGVHLVAVTAFITAWITVGVVQLPAEAVMLGWRFSVWRNLIAFFQAIAIAWLTIATLMSERMKRSEPASGKESDRDHGHNGWWFLLAVVLLYIVIGLLNPTYTQASLVRFVTMLYGLLPALVLVFLFLWLFNLIEGVKSKLGALTGHGSGSLGWAIAITGGIFSHGPIYPWYPLLQDLKKQGMRPALIAAFLYSRSIKLPWLPVMAHYFGISYMVALTFYMALFSILNGWLTERLTGSGAAADET